MTGATAASSGAGTIPRRRGSSLSGQRRWALWGSYAALAVFVAMFLTPPFYMVMTSLKTSAEISAERGNPWLAHHPTLQNFSELIANSNFQHFFLNSVIVTLCVVVISMTISIFAAFSLARIGFLGSQILATGVFLTYLVPGSLLFIPLFQIVGALGLINNVWCLVHAVTSMPALSRSTLMRPHGPFIWVPELIGTAIQWPLVFARYSQTWLVGPNSSVSRFITSSIGSSLSA